jgi:hypothetical protein
MGAGQFSYGFVQLRMNSATRASLRSMLLLMVQRESKAREHNHVDDDQRQDQRLIAGTAESGKMHRHDASAS